jgi:hypothetical protein
MNLIASEVFGFSESLIYFIRDLYDELSETGINVDAWLTELEEKKLIAEYVNGELEKTKSVEEVLVHRVQSSLAELYGSSSEKLNALIFALSKKNSLNKKTIKSRDKVKSPGEKAEGKVA